MGTQKLRVGLGKEDQCVCSPSSELEAGFQLMCAGEGGATMEVATQDIVTIVMVNILQSLYLGPQHSEVQQTRIRFRTWGRKFATHSLVTERKPPRSPYRAKTVRTQAASK